LQVAALETNDTWKRRKFESYTKIFNANLLMVLDQNKMKPTDSMKIR